MVLETDLDDGSETEAATAGSGSGDTGDDFSELTDENSGTGDADALPEMYGETRTPRGKQGE